mgnify:CR=1 FL=1
MKFCPSILDEVATKIRNKNLLHEHSIILGDNASGKSELIRRIVKEKIDKGERVYFIDSVNRYFDVSKIDGLTSSIEIERNIILKRLTNEYFNTKDSFSMYGTETDCIEMFYMRYKNAVQELLKEFNQLTFEVTFPKEKLVRYSEEAEGKLSNGIQALVRIFVELVYLQEVTDSNQIMVVIDEVDEYLSPSNAGKILSFLIMKFPHMQFVVSTHSADLVCSTKNCNLVIIQKDYYEVTDSNDFESMGEVQFMFEKIFSESREQKTVRIEEQLRRLINNKMMGAWGKKDEETLQEIEESLLTNAQKILYKRIKEW